MSYVKLNNTLNRSRVRKDFLSTWATLMHYGAAVPGGQDRPPMPAPSCPRCGGVSFIDLTTAPSEWEVVQADQTYNRRGVWQCGACHLVMIEDYWDWRPDPDHNGEHQKAVLHLVEPSA